MTKKHTPAQFDLFGGLSAPAGLSLQDKVAYVLEHYPEARDDDRLLTLWYWRTWDNLAAVVSEDQFDRLLTWCRNAAHPETIRRRRQEIQKLRTEVGHLLPSDSVAAFRKAQDGAGPPRGGR